MGVPAQVPESAPGWTAQDALDALAERPELARRLAAGEPDALAEYLELMPDVTVRSVRSL